MEKNMYTVADLAKLMNRDKFEVRKAVRFLFDDMEADFGYMLTEEECDQVSRYFANTPTLGTVKGTIHFDVKVEVPDVEGLEADPHDVAELYALYAKAAQAASVMPVAEEVFARCLDELYRRMQTSVGLNWADAVEFMPDPLQQMFVCYSLAGVLAVSPMPTERGTAVLGRLQSLVVTPQSVAVWEQVNGWIASRLNDMVRKGETDVERLVRYRKAAKVFYDMKQLSNRAVVEAGLKDFVQMVNQQQKEVDRLNNELVTVTTKLCARVDEQRAQAEKFKQLAQERDTEIRRLKSKEYVQTQQNETLRNFVMSAVQLADEKFGADDKKIIAAFLTKLTRRKSWADDELDNIIDQLGKGESKTVINFNAPVGQAIAHVDTIERKGEE
ncbi:MAG: hypothetical protein MJZ99_11055 [Bacteroidales bacterium]|nr:hypothetical protein [Bacteroidales bacterium]